jgi:hypothetical protein
MVEFQKHIRKINKLFLNSKFKDMVFYYHCRIGDREWKYKITHIGAKRREYSWCKDEVFVDVEILYYKNSTYERTRNPTYIREANCTVRNRMMPGVENTLLYVGIDNKYHRHIRKIKWNIQNEKKKRKIDMAT